MEMSKKQVGLVLLTALALTLLFVLLFALPVSGKIGTVKVNTLSDKAYSETIVPYFLDSSNKNYSKDTDHFIEGYSAENTASDYCEIYLEVDLKKWTLVPFQTVWVGVESIPEQYRNSVVCVTTGPVMTDCERDTNKGNLTLIVLRNGMSDDELIAMAKAITYDVKWTLAMGVDGHITPAT